MKVHSLSIKTDYDAANGTIDLNWPHLPLEYSLRYYFVHWKTQWFILHVDKVHLIECGLIALIKENELSKWICVGIDFTLLSIKYTSHIKPTAIELI